MFAEEVDAESLADQHVSHNLFTYNEKRDVSGNIS